MTTKGTQMTQNVGLAWHVHHDRLVEWCFDYAERVAYIKSDKPENEQATRLRLFRFVKNPPSAVNDARKAYDDAAKAYDDAWKAYDHAWKAYDHAVAKAMPKLIKLHAVQCPNCTWDGRTIFPETTR